MSRIPSNNSTERHLKALKLMQADYRNLGRLRNKVYYSAACEIAIFPPSTDDYIQKLVCSDQAPTWDDALAVKELINQYHEDHRMRRASKKQNQCRQAQLQSAEPCSSTAPTLEAIVSSIHQFNEISEYFRITLTIEQK